MASNQIKMTPVNSKKEMTVKLYKPQNIIITKNEAKGKNPYSRWLL